MKNQKKTSVFDLLMITMVIILNPSNSFGQIRSQVDKITLDLQVDMKLFNEEMELSRQASDRDIKVEHMKKALSYRPNDSDNIRIEYKMAVLFSQHWDPQNPKPLRREEALTIYEGIINNYEHMDYYDREPMDGIERAQLMVPRAAVHAACLRIGLHNDSLKAQKHLKKSMNCLRQTYKKRIEDWKNEPPPPRPNETDLFYSGPIEQSKWESVMKLWQKRQKDASDGNVFGQMELEITKAAVRQYVYSFGPPQGFADVVSALGKIIGDYPDTPMSKIASEYIKIEKEKLQNRLDRKILEEPLVNLESTSTSIKSRPVVSEKKLASAEIFIPTASIALKHGNPFVLDLSSREFVFDIPLENKIDSRRIYNHLTQVNKGDIAWDGAIVTVRKTKALTIRQESNRPLHSMLGKWVKKYKLPEKLELPYSTLLIADKNLHYLITILEIKPAGIKIKYKKLTAEKAKSYYPIRKNGK